MLYLGKREAGLLTAVSPGDTLIFPFTVVDGTGASVALDTGFGVDNIEVFKNGQPTARATDSGYSLISDTGMMGDRPGLYRISVQLFNTSDDASFYDTGSNYQVAIDSVEVGTLLRRQWIGYFEIGRLAVNVKEIDDDTGPADNLGRIAGDTGQGSYIPKHVWQESVSTTAGDTGSAAYAQGRIMAVRNDTGAAHLDQGRFGVIADSGHIQGSIDTGKVSVAVWNSLRADHVVAATFGHDLLDSGMAATVLDTGKVASAVWVSQTARTVLDTGISQAVWKESPSTYTDTGSFGYATKADIRKVNNVLVNGTGVSGDEWGPV